MANEISAKYFLNREPPFKDISCSLQAILAYPEAIVRETEEIVALARKFNEEVIKPHALELDRKMHEDPDYLPWEYVKEANKWGFFTMWLPKLFGGRGCNMPSLSYFLEELSSGCLAMANLVGVHYLGVGTISATWNTRLMNKVFREVAEGERTGKPCLISLAITEPAAGTDLEEVELLDKAKISGYARKVKGGYLLNGRKVFISNGHISTWHMTIAYTNFKKPSENGVVLAVKTGTKGFSFGRMENKMGQKACPASELIFDECFIPEEFCCFDTSDPSIGKSLGRRQVMMQLIDYVVSTSRAGVCAFGTGVARGAFETALQFAAETEVNGKPMINHEWVQCRLAEMYKNVVVGRMAYAETNYANGLYGLYRPLLWKPFYYLSKWTPKFFFDTIMPPFMNMRLTTAMMRKIYIDWQKKAEYQRTSGLASLAKFVGSSVGVKNCQMALELMGQAGLRQDKGAEKCLRDSKLLQIYEGTNQLNRLNLFKCLVGRQYWEVKVFEE